MDDRNTYKKGKTPDKFSGKELERRPLRNIFIDEKDADIAKILWNFFDAVQDKWPNSWWKVEREKVLNKSTGFIALMRFFKDVYSNSGRIGEVIEKEYYLELLGKSSLTDDDFTRDNFIPGSGGQSQLYRQLTEECIESN
mgnify:FL=1